MSAGGTRATSTNGGWVELLAGQSFFLAGSNSLSIGDPTQTGLLTGLGTPASYIVLAARGGFTGLEGNTKLQLDPNAPMSIQRAEVGARWWNTQRFSVAAGYTYLPANPLIGTIADQHEVSATVGVPARRLLDRNRRRRLGPRDQPVPRCLGRA